MTSEEGEDTRGSFWREGNKVGCGPRGAMAVLAGVLTKPNVLQWVSQPLRACYQRLVNPIVVDMMPAAI